MAKMTTVSCDVKGCKNHATLTDRADILQGWLRRRVNDAVKKTLVAGVRDFDASTDFYYCPEHVEKAAHPPIHPEVLEFIHQKEGEIPER